MLLSKTITGALRMIGVLASGEVPNGNEMEDALEVLNEFIDVLNADGAMITYTSLQYWYPDPNLDATLGRIMTITKNPEYVPDPANLPPGFVYSEAPIRIDSITLADADGTLYKIKQIGVDKYTDMLYDVSVESRPAYYLVDYKGDLVEIYFDTKWDQQYTVVGFCKMPYLGTNGDYKATDDINWEYGIERMLRTNLAVLLAPEYGKEVSPTIYKEAEELKNQIRNKGVNVALMTTGLESNILGDVNSDWREV